MLPETFSGPKGASYRPEMKTSPCLVTNIFQRRNDTRKVLDKKRMQTLLEQMQNSDSGETAPSVWCYKREMWKERIFSTKNYCFLNLEAYSILKSMFVLPPPSINTAIWGSYLYRTCQDSNQDSGLLPWHVREGKKYPKWSERKDLTASQAGLLWSWAMLIQRAM